MQIAMQKRQQIECSGHIGFVHRPIYIPFAVLYAHREHQWEFLSIVVRIGKWGTYFGQSGVRISTISRLVRIYVRIGM